MRWAWKVLVPLVVLVAAGGYAASSLAASDLEVTPRETIVIDAPTPVSQDDDRPRSGEKGDDRGDDGRTSDDDDRVVPPDVDDLDDADDEDEGDGGDD